MTDKDYIESEGIDAKIFLNFMLLCNLLEKKKLSGSDKESLESIAGTYVYLMNEQKKVRALEQKLSAISNFMGLR